jgi:hypothetical protein
LAVLATRPTDGRGRPRKSEQSTRGLESSPATLLSEASRQAVHHQCARQSANRRSHRHRVSRHWRWWINGGAVYALERDQPIVNRNPQGNPRKAKDHEVDVSRVNHQTKKQS